MERPLRPGNPDMDRLVATAEAAFAKHRYPGELTCERTLRNVVNAVLVELRQASRPMKAAGSLIDIEGDYPASFTITDAEAGEVFDAMMSVVLAEPAVG